MRKREPFASSALQKKQALPRSSFKHFFRPHSPLCLEKQNCRSEREKRGAIGPSEGSRRARSKKKKERLACRRLERKSLSSSLLSLSLEGDCSIFARRKSRSVALPISECVKGRGRARGLPRKEDVTVSEEEGEREGKKCEGKKNGDGEKSLVQRIRLARAQILRSLTASLSRSLSLSLSLSFFPLSGRRRHRRENELARFGSRRAASEAEIEGSNPLRRCLLRRRRRR